MTGRLEVFRVKARHLIATGLVLAAFGACHAQAQQPAQSVLAKIKKDGVLKVCYAQLSPESYKDPKTGEWVGVQVDLVQMLADWMKIKIEKVEVTWDVAVVSLGRGDCDLMSALIYNAPRAMQVNYVRSFWSKPIDALIPKGNPKGFKQSSDLNDAGVKLAVVLGSREHETVQRLFPKATILAQRVQNEAQVIDMVKRGDADAAILPVITIKWWLDIPENGAFGKAAFPDAPFGKAPFGWAVRYGDSDWKDFLDAFSIYVTENDISKKLYDDYLARTNPFAK
jgi:ABC-type amino acid transport substrate-binding protein